MRNAPIVPGVPTPFSAKPRPYPTRFHGAIYTRPVFSFPVRATPFQAFTPGYDIDRSVPQPTLSGLGATVGEGRLWEEGRGVFGPGGYGGGVFDGNISGLGSLSFPEKMRGNTLSLGDDAADYPWRSYSDKTKALQKATNVYLAQAALCPIAEDGKLGPSTCGARAYLTANSQKFFAQNVNIANPSACSSHQSEWTQPAALTTGCGNKPTSTTPTQPVTLPATTTLESGMSSSTKRALGFALGGALAIGAVVMLKKRR